MLRQEENDIIGLWKSLYEKHGYPSRKHFNPMDVKPYLSNIAIMERDPDKTPHDYVVRLAGTKIEEMAGVKLTGIRSSEFNDEKTDALFRKSFEKVISLPCAVSFYRKIISPEGRETGVTLTVVPFKGKTGQSPQLMMYNRYDMVAKHQQGPGHFVVKPIEKWDYIDLGFGVPDQN